MPQIEVDFDVWKALTALRMSEEHSYNDVLRTLLQLESTQEPENALAHLLDDIPAGFHKPENGFYSRGLFLPDGTLLRAIYKGNHYTGKIENGQWIDAQGKVYSSPSAAASAVTGNNVNGLRFWEAQLPHWPNKMAWQRLDSLS